MATEEQLKLSQGIVKIKVRILAAMEHWYGDMDTVQARKLGTDPPLYEILREPNMDDELEYKPGDRVYCLDDKERGLVAAWKA